MPGEKIPLTTAAEAKTLVETFGYSERQAGKLLDIAPESVGRIVAGEGNWADLDEKHPSWGMIRQKQKEKWWKSIWSLQPKLLKNIEDKLNLSSAASSAWIFGVLFDKERLLAGESTENISVRAEVAIDMEGAAEKIARSLLRFSDIPNTVSEPQNEAIQVVEEPTNIRSEDK